MRKFIFYIILIIPFLEIGLISFNYVMRPPTHLTAHFMQEAVTKYSADNKSIDIRFNKFNPDKYSLYYVKGIYFYLENNLNDVIKSTLRAGYSWEKDTDLLMAKYIRKGSNVLDIGAHIGTHTTHMAKILNGTGTVWAFEPQTKLFIELNSNLLANKSKNVKTLPYAIGDKEETVEMSPTAMNNEGGTGIGHGGEKVVMKEIDDFNIKNISFIKIDVEGYEDHVLDGARKTILANKPVILCEIMGGNLYSTATPQIKSKIKHTIAKLESLGYRVQLFGGADYLAIPK